MTPIRIAPLLALAGLTLPPIATSSQDDRPATATGVVFHDRDRDGSRGDDEEGIAGVRVSNGREIATTDAEGRYELPIDDDTILFVIKPRGWMTPVNEDHLPRFFYIHKPAGSPESRFPGVAPTGPLPESIDFPLHPQAEPDVFRALFFGDTQPRDLKEVEYIAHDVIEPILREGTDASFGVTLGDIVFDDLSVMDPLNKAIALIGIPWYNVIGNHDMNYDADDDDHSDETFERIYGPSYYAFDHGPVHFLVLDDVSWFVPEGEDRGRYIGGLGARQMEFIRNDLAMIPEDQLVVLMMHIPLLEVEDRQELYRLIEQRPFALSVSAHTHFLEHVFIGEEDGFRGAQPHHHVVNVTVCGSWWSGTPDEQGIPHTTMRDGAPNGYSVFTFDGHDYDIEFRAARRPADHQMTIFAPEEVASSDAGDTEVLVNVFNGSEKSTVEMAFGDSESWTLLEHVAVPDPYYAKMKELEAGANPPPGRKLPGIIDSPHIWRGLLPADPEPGTHVIRVRTTDQFGKTYFDQRIIRVR
ncbi:calcineurin-like phosphoesterase C-terminal domain-containing protein [Tautonia sociabilis]|uniref:calcineurin-like phosphoesterase C-terminal domain-containing protein n=1 Tax=Tautonia sociabilis TaxID=2080755 RepID=UPI001F4095FD|nr:calcineurin-like phosphoesterase family protein [Tautonia sociabilis]